MERYYFNLYDEVITLDEEGVELTDREAAEAYGRRCARCVAAGQVLDGSLALWHRIEIADASGEVLQTISFSDAVELEHT